MNLVGKRPWNKLKTRFHGKSHVGGTSDQDQAGIKILDLSGNFLGQMSSLIGLVTPDNHMEVEITIE